ncbi:MAG: 30S ribosomal protein S21 [Candidatus Heimdallarchaeaceae archaeon]
MSSYHKYYEPKEGNGICVVRKKNESMDELLKRFRKKYSKSGLARELRERMAFEKPSDRKRRKRVQAQRLREKEEEKVKEMHDRYVKKKQRYARKEAKRHDRSTRNKSSSKTFTEEQDTGRDSSTE